MAKNASNYEDQEKMLASQTDAFVDLLTQRGLLKDPKITNAKAQRTRQEYLQRAYHNTELLLANYRMIQWILECYPSEIAAELDAPFEGIDALAEKLDIQACLENRKIENRLNSAVKTRLLLDRLNDALTVLKKKPKNGKLLYELIRMTYIQEDELNHVQVSEALDISVRTYYRLRQEAIEVISTRLWATPNAKMDAWFEVFVFVEGII